MNPHAVTHCETDRKGEGVSADRLGAMGLSQGWEWEWGWGVKGGREAFKGGAGKPAPCELLAILDGHLVT